MSNVVRKLLGGLWNRVANVFGEVVYEAPKLEGHTRGSQFQLRIKKRTDNDELFFSLRIVPDHYADLNGHMQVYIDFSLEQFEAVAAELAVCRSEYDKLLEAHRPQSDDKP